MNGAKDCPINPSTIHAIYIEGNMETIAKMMPINISRTPGIVENIFFRVDFSPKEIQIYTDLFK
jgi:hypothetical protein